MLVCCAAAPNKTSPDIRCLQPPAAVSTSAPSTPELTAAREASPSTSTPDASTSAPSSPSQPPPPTTAGASILPTPATASNFTVPAGYAPVVAFTATFTAIPSKSLTPGQAGPSCQYTLHSPAIAALWDVFVLLPVSLLLSRLPRGCCQYLQWGVKVAQEAGFASDPAHSFLSHCASGEQAVCHC